MAEGALVARLALTLSRPGVTLAVAQVADTPAVTVGSPQATHTLTLT